MVELIHQDLELQHILTLKQEHILHVYLLAAPDLLQVQSFYPLVESHPDVIKRALNLKQLPFEIGGFSSLKCLK